jgi:hypothetical protein
MNDYSIDTIVGTPNLLEKICKKKLSNSGLCRWSAGSSHMGTIVFKVVFRSFAKQVW